MPEMEAHMACPVCLGIPMAKLRPDPRADLVLDHCRRCGGIWFDRGEVGRLRTLRPRALNRRIVLRDADHLMRCHRCGQGMRRNAPICPGCQWTNRIECPVCRRTMRRTERAGMQLDYCGACRGVWFDAIELSQIWNAELEKRAGRRLAPGKHRDGDADFFFLDLLCYDPGAIAGGAQVLAEGGVTAVRVSTETAGALLEGGEVAAAAVEGTGELAGAVFEVIAGIVGGIFS